MVRVRLKHTAVRHYDRGILSLLFGDCSCHYLGLLLSIKIKEPPHDKTNEMACARSEDSDQPGHLPSLIRVFAVCMKKTLVLSYPLSAQRRLIRLGRCPSLYESSLGAHAILLVLSWGSSKYYVVFVVCNYL